jgi:hypothetical protein
MIAEIHPARCPGVLITVVLSLCGFSAGAQDVPPPPDNEDSSDTEAPPADSESQTREDHLEKRVKELEERLETLSNQMESDALERLVQDAENEARAADEEPKPEDREFLAGSLALQKLNPEITLSGDVLASLVINDRKFYATESDRSGIQVRALGLHFQHVLDPYSMFKSALEFTPGEGVHLEELYVSWFGLIPSLSFSAGRFRQGFGVLNRWHEHDLDQTEYPLGLRLVLGDEGLIGDGVMIKWLMPPLWAHANELTLEVVDGNNETLFSGEHFSVPSTMLHLKNYYDLSASTYLELGLTGMFGFNNKRGLLSTDEDNELVDGEYALENESWRKTYVAGADLTLYWSPPKRARYRSFTWRTEFYFASKELAPPERWDIQSSWGLYSYLQYQLSALWFVGVRGDIALPTMRDDDKLAWDVVPYLTFWQSEFVYLRLEYQHGQEIPYAIPEDTVGRRTDNRVLLQIDFAAGPHKHEKY